MSAPTPAPGDDRPREGFYPDPSIPGYVRYWNGAAWVPGTSRPAPTDGEPLAPPSDDGPAGGTAPAASAAPAASVEETGPYFFDEDPVGGPGPSGGSGGAAPSSRTAARHGGPPAPATAWGADRSHQSGFGGDQDRRVSWGAPQGAQPGDPRGGREGADPRVPRAAGVGDGPSQPEGRSARTDGTAMIPPAEPDDADAGNTFIFRRPTAGRGGAAAGAGAPGVPGPGGPPADEGTVTFRALSPRTAQQNRAAGAHQGSTGTPGPGSAQSASGAAPGAFGAQFSGGGGTGTGGPAGAAGGAGGSGTPGSADPRAPHAAGHPGTGAQAASPGASAYSGTPGTPAVPGPQEAPGFGAGKAAAARAAAAQPQAGTGAGAAAQAPSAPPAALSGPQATPAAGPSVPHQSGGPQPTGPRPSSGTPASAPMAPGAGGGQPSWAQQVHRLAGADDGEQPVTPWKPPVDDIFQAAARRQASARPAGLGKRLAARLVDTVVVAGVTAVAAVPLGTKALDHVNEKIDAAKLSGETVTVWLLDGTTSTYLGIVLAVLLVFGALYEALPTAKWGRTLGKKLFGLDVRDIEGHEAPSFGAALRRWLVYSVPGLLVVGVVGVLWCLIDRPWHQCWHDKAAHTFVAG
ncbi:RDD family protein [Streptomyces cellulosae]|uniref:RDD family protein n=1 Tax=Streptomyces cellulosae TaxID=1968 RepID=A0ABW7YDJ9_STRCE